MTATTEMTQEGAKMARIAVIGGGITGVTLAYHLSQSGYTVSLYERSDNPGGLASSLNYREGVRLDRFYHTILNSDLSMQELIRASGVDHLLHFTETKQGFYDAGQLYPFNTPLDFLRFPPLNIFQRFRFGLQIIAAQFERDAAKMDRLPVLDWLMRVSGRGVVDKIWKPLLRAKFDTEVVDVPATYIWSRLRRMMSTRQGAVSKEMMCYLEGGYYTLIEALVRRCEAQGVEFCLNTAVDEIVIENGQAVGIKIKGDLLPYNAVISTVPSPVMADLIPDAPAAMREKLRAQQYLAVLCPLLILRQKLTPYYVLNITDERIPFTAVVETTDLIDPQYVGGYHLVYLPKYLAPGSELAKWSDEQVKAEWLKHFQRMFPDYDLNQIEAFIVQRACYVEPLRPLGTTDQIPTITTSVKHLYLCNTVMVYPDLNNGESVTRLALKTARLVDAELRPASRQQ